MKMMLSIVCILCSTVGILASNLEPKCTSSFDFLEKLLEKVVRFEHKIALMEESMKSFTESVESKITEFTESSDSKIAKFTQSVDSKITEFSEKTASHSDKNEAFVEEHKLKMSDMEKTLKTAIETSNQTLYGMKEHMGSEIQAMIEHTYQKIDEAKDSCAKKDIVFQVKDVDPQPTANSVFKFSTIVTNTDDVFSIDTGYFTAPLPGTYWFAVQICTNTAKYICPTIFINDQLVNRSFIYYKSDGECGTVTAVAVLKVGDKVCVKAGPNTNGGAVWVDTAHNMNTFMGALVN